MKRWLLGLSAAAGLLLLGWGGPRVLRRVELFRVRRIEVVGARYLAPAEIAKAAGLRVNASVFDRLDPLRERVLAMPGVRQVTVRRRIPGALIIEVVEFEPVALSKGEGRLVLVDRRGRILPFDPTRAPTDLPIAPADPAVTSIIEELRDADPDLFGSVESASRDRATVVVETRDHRFLLRAHATPREVQALIAVAAELKRRGVTAVELDARFEGRVVTRRVLTRRTLTGRRA